MIAKTIEKVLQTKAEIVEVGNKQELSFDHQGNLILPISISE